MGVQTSYNYAMPRGVAGSLYDLSDYAADSRLNAADKGQLLFGMGVVTGDSKGINIRVPKTGDTAAKFEGIALNSFTQQHDLDGVVSVSAGAAVCVMRYGRAWGRIPKSVTPEFGDALYLIISGDDAGKFTNAAGDGTTVALKGRFCGSKGTGEIAPVELYNQAQG